MSIGSRIHVIIRSNEKRSLAFPPMIISRRHLILGGAALAFSTAARATLMPSAPLATASLPQPLMRRALQALEQHQLKIAIRDFIGIADFTAPSRIPRFHILDLASGRSRSLLVAHGRGSDPDHSGWLELFSNTPGSAASSDGAYLTGETYVGAHGRSRRLVGLDPQNSNAEARAIVVHAAWYVSPDMISDHGKLGRSEGCFAFDQNDLSYVLDRLGQGRMIYAGKL